MVLSLQCWALPTYPVLGFAGIYCVYSIWGVAQLIMGVYDSKNSAPFILLPTGIVSVNYRVTICNTILLFQIAYLYLVIQSNTYYSPICTINAVSSKQDCSNNKVFLNTRNLPHVCWPKSGGFYQTAPFEDSLHGITVEDVVTTRGNTTRVDCRKGKHACIWAAPWVENVGPVLPNGMHFDVLLNITTQGTCNSHITAVYHAGTVNQISTRIKSTHKPQESCNTWVTAYIQKPYPDVLITPKFSKSVYHVIPNNDAYTPSWFIRTPFESINMYDRYSSLEFVVIGFVVSIVPLAATYYACMNTFHEAIEHAPSTLVFYSHLPALACFLIFGAYVASFGVTMAVLRTLSRNTGKFSMIIIFISTLCFALQIGYGINIVVNYGISNKYHHPPLEWKTTRSHLSTFFDSLFWANKNTDATVFLFYPVIAMCLYLLYPKAPYSHSK